MSHYIEQYGHVYKMSTTAYKKLLRLIRTGREWDLDTLGAKPLGRIAARPLNMSPMEAQEELKALNKDKDADNQ